MKALDRTTRSANPVLTRRLVLGAAGVLLTLMAYAVFSGDESDLPDRYHEVDLIVTGMH